MVFSRFGRQIFNLYNERPLLMNSIVGGTVYFGGEVVVEFLDANDKAKTKKAKIHGDGDEGGGESQISRDPSDLKERLSVYDSVVMTQVDRIAEKAKLLKTLDLKVCAELGTLGAIENGAVMLTWYNFLAKMVGSGNSTSTVLIKCLLDQIFFATQQDGIFLGICAINHSDELPEAIKELNSNFLTTWINDCSLWPLVNFVGFAYVPLAFQPTYVSMVQFFWQIYISSVASKSATKSGDSHVYLEPSEIHLADDKAILSIFRQIDKDSSGFIDINELQEAFKLKNVTLSKNELHEMVLNIRNTQKQLHKNNKMNNKNSNTNVDWDHYYEAHVKATPMSLTLLDPSNNQKDNIDDNTILISYEDFKYLYQHDRGKFEYVWGALVNPDILKKGFKAIMKKLDNVKRREGITFEQKEQSGNVDFDHYYETTVAKKSDISALVHSVVKAWNEADKGPKNASWRKDREESVQHATIGCSILFVIAVVRRLVFKI